MLQLVLPKRRVQFTAGDLIEGLAYMEPVQRRAVLFGLEQRLPSVDRISMLGYREALKMPLTDLGLEIVRHQPRHIRLPFLFWEEGPRGVRPVLGLDNVVRTSFGGMSYADLLGAYQTMAWIDDELETEFFIREAGAVGLPFGIRE